MLYMRNFGSVSLNLFFSVCDVSHAWTTEWMSVRVLVWWAPVFFLVGCVSVSSVMLGTTDRVDKVDIFSASRMIDI